jgi:ABC-type phosphate transport system substrate-binding protein
MKKNIIKFITVLFWLPMLAWGQDILVVVNADNPLAQLTKQQVTDLYMGRVHYFPSGNAVMKIDAPGDSILRGNFYKQLVGLSLPDVNAYWARLMFSGRATPPMQVSNSKDIALLVAQNPSALGYIQKGDENEKTKTIFVIHIVQ